MQLQHKLAIATESSQALHKHLSRYAVSVFDTNDDPTPQSWGVFSGTLVSIGERVFMATASHCVQTPASSSRYWILGDQPRLKSEGIPVVVAAWSTPNNFPDVGVFELDGVSLANCTPKIPCPIDRLKISGTGRSDRLASLVGNPGQYLEKESRSSRQGLKAVVISYNSLPIGISEWPRFKADPALDQGVDILMHYPSGTGDTTQLDTGLPIELPNPEGMSGGGLWDQGFGIKGVWSVDDAFLFGIQRAWFSHHRFVRAVQIKHWLRLVYQHYPDLHTILDGQFPDLHHT